MRLRLGVSACLLGEAVRYDGAHKRDRFLTETLGPWVQWVPVCPEVELGLGVPREPIRLEGDPGAARLVATRTRTDHTRAMTELARARVETLVRQDLAGYVLKRDSPSCGPERVRVYGQGRPSRRGVGLFARAITERLPLLPVEDEARLEDPTRRENFVERLFAYARWQRLGAARATRRDLVRFHTAHELQLLAHDPAAHRRLGRLVARAAARPLRETLAAYGPLFMAALAVVATRQRHVKVLANVLDRLSPRLEREARAELRAAIAAHRRRSAPLVVPLALARRHARRLAVDGLAEQTYLDPHPLELMLRNAAG